jgi:quercetin dioxygenase-like cupin family protein
LRGYLDPTSAARAAILTATHIGCKKKRRQRRRHDRNSIGAGTRVRRRERFKWISISRETDPALHRRALKTGSPGPSASTPCSRLRIRLGSAPQVTFEPGARTAWHTHPLGQTLIVTAGLGWVQREGGPVEEIRPGDVVWFPPGLKHWHGASPTTAMTHIAVQESSGGKNVEWMEKVSDDQYRG